jgi:site-specific DNA-methyltransferase (adenine-specific)
LPQLARAHAHETLIWASKGKGHAFNHDLLNGPDPTHQISSVWRLPAVPQTEKRHGRHPTQKPLRLVRRALLASTQEGALVFDPFCGSGTTAVAAKELGRFFVGAELERCFCELAGRRIVATGRGGVPRALADRHRDATTLDRARDARRTGASRQGQPAWHSGHEGEGGDDGCL